MDLPFNGLDLHLGNLSRMSNAETRSISAENPAGEKGCGAAHGLTATAGDCKRRGCESPLPNGERGET